MEILKSHMSPTSSPLQDIDVNVPSLSDLDMSSPSSDPSLLDLNLDLGCHFPPLQAFNCSQETQNITTQTNSPSLETPEATEKEQRENQLQDDDRENEETPRRNKKPKRKKYTPKVIREWKPPRKPKTPAQMTNPLGKRKYVRKTQTQAAEAQHVNRRLDFGADGKQSDSDGRGTKRKYSCSSGAMICKKKRSKRKINIGWIHNTFESLIFQKRNSVLDQVERETSGKSVPPHPVDCHQISSPIMPSNHNNINCNPPPTPAKISECNKAFTPRMSSDLHTTNCSGSLPTPEKALGSDDSLEYMTYGPQARIEALIAIQVNVRGRRSRKLRSPLVNLMDSDANHTVDVAATGKTFSSDKKLASQSPDFETGNQVSNCVHEDVTAQPQNALVPCVGDPIPLAGAKNAVVPYAGSGGMMVPFKLVKKKKLTGNVDLDPESLREWELVIGIKSPDADDGTTNINREKHWEEQRRIFSNRAQSFIKRMQIILGDRKFSPWKGSVLDSVIGVYLTQNVSDVLSSSAFMSLAARFPLRSKGDNESANEEMTSSPTVVDGSNKSSEKMSEQFCDQTSSACAPKSKNSDQPTTCFEEVSIERKHFSCQSDASSEKIISEDGNNVIFQQREGEGKFHTEETQHAIGPQSQHLGASQTSSDSPNNDLQNNSNPIEAELKSPQKVSFETLNNTSKNNKDWDKLRKQYHNKARKERSDRNRDSLDYEAVRCADWTEISKAIKKRGQNNLLAKRIKAVLERLVENHGSTDLEWLRDVPPDEAKAFLKEIDGLGIKSVECVRLLTLYHQAFPVDTNVGRICVRLGWVPLEPLPESTLFHLLEMYPVQENIQKYLWPRLCKLDHETLYMLHCLLITFGKVFCTKSDPNCKACPMRGDCKHFASASVNSRLMLPGPKQTSSASSAVPNSPERDHGPVYSLLPLPQFEGTILPQYVTGNWEPRIEVPATPERELLENLESDIEDIEDIGGAFYGDSDELMDLSWEGFKQNVQNYFEMNMELKDNNMSKSLVSITPEAASIPMPKLKNKTRLHTTHLAYVVEDEDENYLHHLLGGLDRREPDDPGRYLLAMWAPGETAESIEPPKVCCNSQDGHLCQDNTCFSCSNMRETQAGIVRCTLLIPCRTGTRGSFPLNGTYFQFHEVFADHYTSHTPLDVPRDYLWRLKTTTVFFGTSIQQMLKGLPIEKIMECFLKGYVCVRGFNRETRDSMSLSQRFHISVAMSNKIQGEKRQKERGSNTKQQKAKKTKDQQKAKKTKDR